VWRPEISLAHAAGISCNRGIVVDDGALVGERVYPSGTAPSSRRRLGIIPAALEQAPVAARQSSPTSAFRRRGGAALRADGAEDGP
jgi:NAD(P)H-nitrite reductase large subunit